MPIAIFDLDNTLIAGDSDHAWGEFLIEQNLVDKNAYRLKNDQFYRDYTAGRLNIMNYLEFCLAFLATQPLNALLQLREQFFAEKIRPLFLPKAFDLVEEHRQQNHILLVITSTNRFVCEPIVERFGITHLIATEPEFINGHYTGKVVGTPSYKEGKVVRLQSWLKEQQVDLQGSFGYSDSHNDIPLLEQVDHPVVVDGDAELIRYAKQRQWQMISLR